MAASKFRELVKIAVFGGAAGFVLLLVWIGTLLLLARLGHETPANSVFEGIVVSLLAFGMLPLLHRGLYRTFWRNEERQRLGLPEIQGTYLDGNQSMPPPAPKTNRTAAQTALYAACYALGISALFWAYLPFEHVSILMRFVGRHSAGRDSAGSLLAILLAYVPMVVLLLPLMFAMEKERQGIAMGAYAPEETLRRRLKQDWLLSFVAALIGTSIFCQLASSMVLRYL